MDVILINSNVLTNLFKNWGFFSGICTNNLSSLYSKADKLGRKCLKSNHFSGSRGIYLDFYIKDISRGCADQLFRHEVGVVKNMQSTRYVDLSNFTYHISEDILKNEEALKIFKNNMEQTKKDYVKIIELLMQDGVEKKKAQEQARGLLGLDVHTNVMMGFTIEALINLMHKRLCIRSQKEIRNVVQKIKDEVIKFKPELEEYLVPQCEYLTWCPEENSCGKFNKKLGG